jgi:tetratricopeptide (TPR) repeat protein
MTIDDIQSLMNNAWARRRAALAVDGEVRARLIEQARGELEAAIDLTRVAEDQHRLAQALHLLANLERDDGLNAVAEALWVEAVDVLRTLDDTDALAHKIRHLADLKRQMRQFDAASALFTEAMALYRSSDNPPVGDFANAMIAHADLLDALGSHGQALDLWREAKSLYGEIALTEGIELCAAAITRLEAQTSKV